MGSTKAYMHMRVSDPGYGMSESSVESESESESEAKAEYFTAHAPSSLGDFSESIIMEEIEPLGDFSESIIMEEIERSKQHWSLLAEFEEVEEVGERLVAEVDNVDFFKSLQMHPSWGHFFRTFGHDVEGRFGSEGELVVGEKFAEGGQADLHHVKVIWKDASKNEWDLENGDEWVLKVFKEGTFLRQVFKQVPHGYLQFMGHELERENWKSATPKQSSRYHSEVVGGTLLEDGRFAFLMKKYDLDLRSLIEQQLQLRSCENCGPFSRDDAEWLMYGVAEGVKWLHDYDIVHRDLKASNVLLRVSKNLWPKWTCFIADYECSVGVVGTGFFRAPEILQAVKDRELSLREEVFSKAADVYSYGMVCYEILTGRLPSEGYHPWEYDWVLHGQQLQLPEYIDDWTCSLLSRCWQLNTSLRPSMEEIVNVFLDRSPKIREFEANIVNWREQNQ